MFKRFLTIFLILSTLSYSSVWALDSHENESGKQDQSQSHTVDNQPDNTDHQLDDDHCCHAGAHLLGLLNQKSNEHSPDIHINVSHYQFHLNDYHNSPPQRPPLS